jgi:predicted dehydrogenase
MSDRPWRAVLIGLGRVGMGYADDPVMARSMPYAAHAQVLADHPEFEWGAVVDLSEDARAEAVRRWQVAFTAATAEEVAEHYAPEVAVLATPPEVRLSIVDRLPGLRGVMVEKPLGRTAAEAEEFLALCAERRIAVQVNLWRRGDEQFRGLAAGRMRAEIGDPQAVFGVYGNGLVNNGTHMVDLVRMLIGEFETVNALPRLARSVSGTTVGAIGGDLNVPFAAQLAGGAALAFLPLDFRSYREVGIDVWGTTARMAILHEGLSVSIYPRAENRLAAGLHEIASDRPVQLPSTIGHALYHLYTNLAGGLSASEELWSPGAGALRAERVIDAVRHSVDAEGAPIDCRNTPTIAA